MLRFRLLSFQVWLLEILFSIRSSRFGTLTRRVSTATVLLFTLPRRFWNLTVLFRSFTNRFPLIGMRFPRGIDRSAWRTVWLSNRNAACSKRARRFWVRNLAFSTQHARFRLVPNVAADALSTFRRAIRKIHAIAAAPVLIGANAYTAAPLHLSFCRSTSKNDIPGNMASASVRSDFVIFNTSPGSNSCTTWPSSVRKMLLR